MRKQFAALPLLIVSIFLLAILATGAAQDAATGDYSVAYFAGGCFWCVEADFEKHDGVLEVISGYQGGDLENPTYKQVASHTTGHREAVEVRYDPEVISYQELLDIFWRLHDPSDAGGSFVDRGFSYSSAIFYADSEQQRLAEGAKAALDASGKLDAPVSTEILPATPFYHAEEFHQDYYVKRPIRYKFYRSGSGRDKFVNRVWKGDTTVYQTAENLAGN